MDVVFGTEEVKLTLLLGLHVVPGGFKAKPEADDTFASVFTTRAETVDVLMGVREAPLVDEGVGAQGCEEFRGDLGNFGHLIFSCCAVLTNLF